ncbi:MAG: CapA family protein [Bryobacteraceae bacterium]|nr:CapA family protein [Bryobacteraceae bacterium]
MNQANRRPVALAILSLLLFSAPLPAPDEPDDGNLSVLLVGDIMLGRLVNDVLKTKPPDFPFGDTLPFFQSADLAAANLECVLADRGEPWTRTPKTFHFRSDARNVVVLQTARLDFVSVANNHSIDYGYFALRDMLEVLEHAGIASAGAGQNTADACRPAFKDVRGLRAGFLAFTDNEPAWASRADYPGTCYTRIDMRDPRAQSILDRVRLARREAALVIASVHWGGNWGQEPPKEHVWLARALIDAGADIVFGHSPHVFRGIEIYKGKPILYSAGDFIDDYAVDPNARNDQSFLFHVDLVRGRIHSLRLYPTVIDSFQARLARGEAAEQIAARMQALCAAFKTTADWDPAESCLRILIP